MTTYCNTTEPFRKGYSIIVLRGSSHLPMRLCAAPGFYESAGTCDNEQHDQK